MPREAAARRDAVSVEIFANLFKAIVDEMAWIVLRSSHTTFVKETQDFGVALVTPEGEMFAYPYGSGATPLMGVAMHAGTRAVPHWEPGDVLITNNPYSTGGMVMHLNDIYLFRPVFVDGELLCFAWCFIHCTDVGGYAPGSIDMQNSEAFQEGLRLRPVKLFRRGELNEELGSRIFRFRPQRNKRPAFRSNGADHDPGRPGTSPFRRDARVGHRIRSGGAGVQPRPRRRYRAVRGGVSGRARLRHGIFGKSLGLRGSQ